MIAKFISLLVLLLIIAGLIYVAVTDVNIAQTQRIVKVETQQKTAQPSDSNQNESAAE